MTGRRADGLVPGPGRGAPEALSVWPGESGAPAQSVSPVSRWSDCPGVWETFLNLKNLRRLCEGSELTKIDC